MRNIMSIDVEDWFCVYNLSHLVPYSEWDQQDRRVERNTLLLLDLFARHKVEETFFVLGWVADRYPDLVREIERQGHEVGTHGHTHRLLTQMNPAECRKDILDSLESLSRCVRHPVLGFRAPSFSLTQQTRWAVPILKEAGLRYDSSVFPIGFHPDYGIGDAPLAIHQWEEGLTEVPMSCAELFGKRIPCSGGGYFRQFPYEVTKQLMRRCNQQGRPVVFYLHPWEVDPGQPRLNPGWLKSLRHYRNLDLTVERLERLMEDFEFTSMRSLLNPGLP
jgi:polysaccharide deacetylase family protein (PEP-CTERM system associated)